MKVIIAGGRDFTPETEHWDYLEDFIEHNLVSMIVSGGAKGADAFGEQFAFEFDLGLAYFPADWDTHGKSAGYIRNAEMADYADALIAFPGGKGTANMIEVATRKGLEVFVYG